MIKYKKGIESEAAPAEESYSPERERERELTEER